MTITTQQATDTRRTPGFGFRIEENTNLNIAILMADFGEGQTAPVATASSISEAREMAASDMRCRMRELENGGSPACPEAYVLWAQGIEGTYREVTRLQA